MKTRHALTAIALGCLVAVGTPVRAESSSSYKILPLGDSITVGIGSVGSNGRTDFNGWRDNLMTGGLKWLHADYVGTCPNVNASWKCIGTPTMSDRQHAGSSGWRSDEILARTGWYVDTFKPNAVLLQAGVNDLAQGRQAGYGERMGAIIDTILRHRPGTQVFVGTMIQQRDPIRSEMVATMNAELVSVVRTKPVGFVHLVPIHIVGNQPTKELWDNVHPNNCGYARMAYVWYAYMARVYSPAGRWPVMHNPFYGECR